MMKVIDRGMTMNACAMYSIRIILLLFCSMLTVLKGMWKKKGAMMGMSQRRNQRRCVTYR